MFGFLTNRKLKRQVTKLQQDVEIMKSRFLKQDEDNLNEEIYQLNKKYGLVIVTNSIFCGGIEAGIYKNDVCIKRILVDAGEKKRYRLYNLVKDYLINEYIKIVDAQKDLSGCKTQDVKSTKHNPRKK